MAQGKPQQKFERNPCIKFRGNCDTDGRQTTDKLRFHELCWHSQAELKFRANKLERRKSTFFIDIQLQFNICIFKRAFQVCVKTSSYTPVQHIGFVFLLWKRLLNLNCKKQSIWNIEQFNIFWRGALVVTGNEYIAYIWHIIQRLKSYIMYITKCRGWNIATGKETKNIRKMHQDYHNGFNQKCQQWNCLQTYRNSMK